MDNSPAVTLEWSKANYTDHLGDRLAFFNTVGFLGVQLNITPSLSFIGEVPFVSWDVEDPIPDMMPPGYGWDDQLAIGNPLVGIEYSQPGSRFLVRIGVRPPLTADGEYWAKSVGVYGAGDRWEAFIPDLWTVAASGGVRLASPGGAVANISFGPTLLKGECDSELLADYSALCGYRGSSVRFAVEIAGRMLVTEDTRDFSDRFDHFLGLAFGVRFGSVEPGIQFRYALDEEYRDELENTLGINFKLALGSNSDELR
jgi:hypothetical protein